MKKFSMGILKKKLFVGIGILMFLCWYSITGLCYAEETQPFNLPFKADIVTLYDFQHKTITLGGGVDFLSIYDVLYVGIMGVGATEGNFFSEGLIGGQANVDVNKGVMLLAEKLNFGDKVKWLQGQYFPRIGYSLTYNVLNNEYYNSWNHFLTLRILSF
jgi:hypothetical protein